MKEAGEQKYAPGPKNILIIGANTVKAIGMTLSRTTGDGVLPTESARFPQNKMQFTVGGRHSGLPFLERAFRKTRRDSYLPIWWAIMEAEVMIRFSLGIWEISRFWQKRQRKLQPAVAIE